MVKAKADVNAKDKNDVTPLHRAAYWYDPHPSILLDGHTEKGVLLVDPSDRKTNALACVGGSMYIPTIVL